MWRWMAKSGFSHLAGRAGTIKTMHRGGWSQESHSRRSRALSGLSHCSTLGLPQRGSHHPSLWFKPFWFTPPLLATQSIFTLVKKEGSIMELSPQGTLNRSSLEEWPEMAMAWGDGGVHLEPLFYAFKAPMDNMLVKAISMFCPSKGSLLLTGKKKGVSLGIPLSRASGWSCLPVVFYWIGIMFPTLSEDLNKHHLIESSLISWEVGTYSIVLDE